MVLIIDGDFIPYRVGFTADKNGYNWDYAKRTVTKLLGEFCREAGTNEILGFLGGKTNFRNELVKQMPQRLMVPDYKGNRKAEKPSQFYNIKDFLHEHYGFHIVDGIEADDACGIALTMLGENGILLSTDKDVLQVPGYHLQSKNSGYVHSQSTKLGTIALSDKRDKIVGSGDLLLWSQVLTGDGVDNFKGVPKCGPVRAYELLKDIDNPSLLPGVVFSEYRRVFDRDAESMFRLTWNLAYILRKHKNLSQLPQTFKLYQ
jgi:5'-3' exonuclease